MEKNSSKHFGKVILFLILSFHLNINICEFYSVERVEVNWSNFVSLENSVHGMLLWHMAIVLLFLNVIFIVINGVII